MLVMTPAARKLLRKAERAREAKRGRLLGEQRHAQLVAAVAAILRQGDPTPFRFEAGCIVALRRKLILAGGWFWRDADAAAREVTLDALAEIGAKRPTWAEASTPHYAQADAFSLFERTRCRQCGGRLPEENRTYCTALCRKAYGNALGYAERTAFAAMVAEGL